MRVRVVGGGWYGCFIATTLIELGHDVRLFERGKQLFAGASGANQSRLHLGFHYPRDAITRREALAGYGEFMSALPNLSRVVPVNLYAIANSVSLIDFDTYSHIMRASDLDFMRVRPEDFGLIGLEGALQTGERLILADHAREHFTALLFGRVEFESEADPEDGDWDATVDCTFGSFRQPAIEWFEPCILLLYEGAQTFALTVMDGPEGCSVYPYYQDGLVSLTSVSETPMARCSSMAEARYYIDGLGRDMLAQIATRMESRISRYMPDFQDRYMPVGWTCSVRVKPKSASDRRSHVVIGDGGYITVFPGKISGIFDAARQVRGVLGC